MSQVRQSSPKHIRIIETALSSENSVRHKKGFSEFHLNPADYLHVEHLLWQAILSPRITKEG